MKSSGTTRSNCEKDFVLNAIDNGIRLDGRQNYQSRKPIISFGESFGHCEVWLGNTRCLAQVSCAAVKPNQNRPTQGQLILNLELSPMASPAFETGRPSDYAVEINRFIERCLKESRPIDLESLCILAEEKVWSLRVDIQVMDDAGNILDCACIAAISALSHFRRPDVTVVGKDVTVHSADDREPIPLNVHHIPVCVTFGFIGSRDKPIVDPTELEEVIIDGYMIMALNSHSEICCARMCGVPVHSDQIMMCCNIASARVNEITEIIKNSLEKDKKKRFPQKDQNNRESIGKDFEEMMITKTIAEPTNIDITDSLKEAAENSSNIKNDISQASPITLKSSGIAGIGHGKSSAWVGEIVNDDDNNMEMDDSDLVIIDAPKQTAKSNNYNKIDVNASSDEEETMELTSEDLGFKRNKPIEIDDENTNPEEVANREDSQTSEISSKTNTLDASKTQKKKSKKRKKNK